MTPRLCYKIIASLSSSSAEEKDLFNYDPGIAYQKSDEMDGGTSRLIPVPTGTDDMVLDVSGLVVSFLLLRSDRTLSISLDEQILTLHPLPGADFGFLLLTTNGINEILISNNSGYKANLWVTFAGTEA